MAKESLLDVLRFDHLLENQEMPLLVVLLLPCFGNKIEYPACKVRLAVFVGHRDIRDLFPCLIRHACDHFKNLKLRKSTRTTVYKIQADEQCAREEAISKPWGRQSPVLFVAKIFVKHASW